ncbi:MAG: ABC transporter ATP-binding protein [Desulfurococcaceae archaeon TW002]
MRNTLLELKDIEAGYGVFRVLHGVSLKVDKEEIVALVGPNGAGKTTTLKTIAGLTNLFKGEIMFDGLRINDVPPHNRIRKGLVLVPEGRGIFASLTVLENLYLGAYHEEARQKLSDSLEIVFTIFPKLKERKNQIAGTLSGGESQMLAIGRALMSRPKILLLDEPSLGLAPKIVSELFEIFKRLNDEWKVTLLLVEQHVKNSLEISHRAYVMESGRIVLEGESSVLINDERLRKAYLII